MQKLLVIGGATATGKTEIAVHLAKLFGGELVSADSRQVYKGMDIGTGKDLSEVADIPLWMIDVVAPDEEFSVSHYARLAKSAITDIRKRKKLPIVVGGTGLYIQSLTHGFDTIDIPPNKKLREKLKDASVRQLQGMIDRSVLDTMNESDKNNPRRLIRKIEIIAHTTKSRIVEDQDVLFIGLTAPMEELYRRIDARVEKRVTQGIKDEIQTLLRKGYSWDLPSMNTLGYKQWKDAFSDEEAIIRWKYDEHAYARRQITWFRKEKNIVWFDIHPSNSFAAIEKLVREWYTKKYYDNES